MTENEALYILNNCKFDMRQNGAFNMITTISVVTNALKELQQYREIGTVEECREAVEKQKQKRPIKILVDPFEYDYDYICPNCRRDLNDPKLEAYCRWCGQAIQWYE